MKIGIVHRHFRTGGRYLPIALAHRHTHNGDQDVVYISLDKGEYNTRPWRRDSRGESSWMDRVEWPNGHFLERFEPENSPLLDLHGMQKFWAAAPIEREPVDAAALARAAWVALEEAFAAFARVRPINGATVGAWEDLVDARDRFRRASRFGVM